jgi:hypothetical protein
MFGGGIEQSLIHMVSRSHDPPHRRLGDAHHLGYLAT